MTNFEKFGKELKSTSFGVVKGKPSPCPEIECSECEFNSYVYCGYNRMDWLKAEYTEYIEPKITIPEGTKIDTKILVSDDGKKWDKRHYAGKKNGIHSAWYHGKTSWTSYPDQRGVWEYMKLYSESEQ